MWVLDHLDDIDSDMSAFHRVDEPRLALSGPLYFARAVRLGAYPGVMQARIAEARERERNGQSPAARGQAPAVTVKMSDDVLLAQLANEGWVER